MNALFLWIALAVLAGVPAYAWAARGRPYALFGFVILAIALAGAIPLHQRLVAWAPDDVRPWIDAAFAYGALAGGAHLAHLVRARLRSTLFRGLVSIPGMVFIAVGALSGLWLLGWNHGLVALRWLDLLPVAVGVASVGTSLRAAEEIVRIPLGSSGPEEVTRLPVERYRRRTPAPLASPALRIVQITDPHLGPWQPVHRLQRVIADLVAHQPDLVLLTGDFLTMEGAGSPGALAKALE